MIKESKYIIIFIIYTLLSVNSLFAQYPRINFRSLSTDDGLANNSTHCILQDKQGYLWFGTIDGLNRYNGNSFKVFKHDPDDPASISSNDIRCLYIDNQDRLWVGTLDNGLNLFDYETEKFTHFHHNPDDSTSLCQARVSAIAQDGNNDLWVGTYEGLNRFDAENNCFEHFFTGNSNHPLKTYEIILDLFKSHDGNLWIGTSFGLKKYDIKEHKFINYEYLTNEPGQFMFGSVNTICEDMNNEIWLGTAGFGVYKFNPQNEKVKIYKHIINDSVTLVNDRISSLFHDSQNRIWVGSRKGLDLFDEKTESFEHMPYEPHNPLTLTDPRVFDIYQDSNGVLWVATGKGINLLPNYSKHFYTFQKKNYNKNSLSGYSVSAILYENESKLWIGTSYSGLDKYNFKTNKFEHYLADPKNENSLSNNKIRSIYRTREGLLLIGTYGGGLNIFDEKRNRFHQFKNIQNDSSSLHHNIVRCIHQDKKGRIWIGTLQGLTRFYPETKTFVDYSLRLPNGEKGLRKNIFVIDEDKDGILWAATYGKGIARFDPDQMTLKYYMNDPDNINSLASNSLLGLMCDHRGNVWAATHYDGVDMLNPAKNEFVHFTTENGLPANSTFSIQEDNSGNVWIGTTHGLAKYDPDLNNFHVFTQNHGLQDNEFNTGAYYKNKNGFLFWGGISGVTYFHPDSIKNEFTIPKIVIDDIKLFNESVKINKKYHGVKILDRPISMSHEIELNYKDNVLTFELAVLNFKDPQSNSYAYFMEGLEKVWNYAGARNFATYSNIPPGQYTFHVKGASSENVWNDDGVSLKIIINPPFWQTWWFKGLLIVSSFILIISSHLVRVHRMTMRHLELENINNQLNDQITERKKAEEALQKVNDDLEKIVEDRTDELKETNLKLLVEIDGHKRAVFASQVSEEKYRMLAETASDIIFVNDQNKKVTYMNPAGLKISGYKESEILSKSLEHLLPVEFVVDFFEKEINTSKKATGIHLYETEFINKGGKKIPIELNSSSLYKDKTFTGTLIVARDITERKKAEEQIRSSLKEKEILLKEIHHRVKNNMQVISSLLHLQSRQVKDDKTQNIFTESQNRIKSMALVHERLYRSDNLAKIDFNNYIRNLIVTLYHSYNIDPNRIILDINVNNVFLSIDTAIPCGLIINEIITNSFKHAFPDNANGVINIEFFSKDERYHLIIKDNGVGLPEEVKSDGSQSLGLFLISALIRQLTAELEIVRESGTKYTITFTEVKKNILD